MKIKSFIQLAAAAAITMAPLSAHAGDPTEEARVLFDAGARAYKAGDFRAAIQAFEQAYKIEARPNLLFSIAQAHRRQYVLDRRAGHVAVAVKYLRDYLSRVPQGGRRADAVAALGELEPLAAQLEREGQLQPLGEAEQATRLMVSSPVDGATVTLDGDHTPRVAPVIVEVKPGKHAVRVQAPGHAEEVREIEAPRGAVTALDIALHELPARLAVGGLRGAEVSVDGRVVGAIPFATPIEVAPGLHRVRVSKSGYEDFQRDVNLGRGAIDTLDARLARTTQRKVSIGLMGAGAAVTAVGVVVGGLALAQQARATSLKGDFDDGKVICRTAACPQLDDYNAAASARDRLRGAAGALLGTGIATAGTGLLLFLFDEPRAHGGAHRDDASPPPRPREAPVEISATPVLGPGAIGASVSGRF